MMPEQFERDNPFQPGGAIDKECDEILRNSRISGTEIVIIDPKQAGVEESPTQKVVTLSNSADIGGDSIDGGRLNSGSVPAENEAVRNDTHSPNEVHDKQSNGDTQSHKKKKTGKKAKRESGDKKGCIIL